MSLNHIRLPQNDLLQFEPRDHRFFETAFNQTAQADTMFVQVMQEYVLCTISECIRVIERMPPRSQLAESVMFKAVPRQKLPANAPWDALILVSSLPSRLTRVNTSTAFRGVSDLHPGHTSLAPFQRSTRVSISSSRGGHLHNLPYSITHIHVVFQFPPDFKNQDQPTMSDSLWGMVCNLLNFMAQKSNRDIQIHDACFMRSRYFVVTNYLTWTFGYFAPSTLQSLSISVRLTTPIDQTTAYISETYHPIMMLDANDRFDPAPDESKRNVAEYLLYWVQRARGAAR